jgi:hypothetical protein
MVFPFSLSHIFPFRPSLSEIVSRKNRYTMSCPYDSNRHEYNEGVYNHVTRKTRWENPLRPSSVFHQVDEWKEEKHNLCYANQRYYSSIRNVRVLDLV